MNYIIVLYISIVLRIKSTHALFEPLPTFGNVSAPFAIAQTPPTQPDTNGSNADNYPSASESTHHSDSTTTTMPIYTSAVSSQNPTNASPTENTTVLPEIVTTRIPRKTRLRIIRENRRRCHNLPTTRLRWSCKAIVEEMMQDADYLYVVTNSRDVARLKRDLWKRNEHEGRFLDSTPIFPGDQHSCKRLTCPTTEKWLKGAHAHERSTSPWKYCDNYDPNR